MLFSYIEGHVPENIRKKTLKNQKVIKKIQKWRFFLHTLYIHYFLVKIFLVLSIHLLTFVPVEDSSLQMELRSWKLSPVRIQPDIPAPCTPSPCTQLFLRHLQNLKQNNVHYNGKHSFFSDNPIFYRARKVTSGNLFRLSIVNLTQSLFSLALIV